MKKKGIVVRLPDSLFLKFCEIWLHHAALPAVRNAPPSLRDELALDWWRSLDRADREACSEEIGVRIEIAGTQYMGMQSGIQVQPGDGPVTPQRFQ